MVIGGRNTGRVGIITHREKHASKYLCWGAGVMFLSNLEF